MRYLISLFKKLKSNFSKNLFRFVDWKEVEENRKLNQSQDYKYSDGISI